MKRIALILLLIFATSSTAAEYSTDGYAERWVTKEDGVIVNSGVLSPTDRLLSRRTVIKSSNDNEFLELVAEEDFPALPESGWLEEGTIYDHNGTPVLVRQSHNRTEHAPADVPALFSVYRVDADGIDWIANEPVDVGMLRVYGGTTYACIQSHTTQEDWTPDATPSLWTAVSEPPAGDEWATGVAYIIGDIVTYEGSTYECRQAHTSQVGWNPPAVPALWLLVEE